MWWYLFLYGILAIWILTDAWKRQNNRFWWPLATFGFELIALPVYFAKRNLKEGEVREGGTGWNVLKNFALLWTLTMAVVAIAGIVGVFEVTEQAVSGAEQVGAVIGGAIGLGMIGFLWFSIAIAVLVLGMFLKKSSIVEKGPTGSLAKVE